MREITIALMLLAASNGLCQTAAKETPEETGALQSLLAEVRQLRKDIEGLTVATQRVQIALYGLQIQDAAVARAAQRLDDARNRRSGAESGRNHIAADVQSIETKLASGTLPEADTRPLQDLLTGRKRELDSLTAEVQNRQAAEAEASNQFRVEQAKLAELQDRIERLDKGLEKLGGGGK